jgi:hypothetical protein
MKRSAVFTVWKNKNKMAPRPNLSNRIKHFNAIVKVRPSEGGPQKESELCVWSVGKRQPISFKDGIANSG